MSRPERQQNVLALLKELRGIEPLKKLFWSELNYQRVNEPLSRRGWTESARQALAEDPVLFAGGGENNDFHVIYGRLASDRLLLGNERPVVSRLVKEHPYALFVFSNKAQDRWHFLNVKYDDTAEKRRLFRRLTVHAGEGQRTASERLALLDLASFDRDMFGISALEIQQRHDEAFDVEKVTKDFYGEIANWYFWALDQVEFPMPKGTPNPDAYKAQSLIRLITRLIFCWFVKEKGLIPQELFDLRALAKLLTDGAKLRDSEQTTYYKAILQNLFFATLNQEMGKRAFRKRHKDPQGRDPHRGITNLYRYEDYFTDPKAFLDLMRDIPFLNGGLFECLDKVYRAEEKLPDVRIDGFSDHPKNPLCVPDFLFFGDEQTVDLAAAYGEKRYRQATVGGLIHTFHRYKFTITENTPLDQEVALDPELSGKVFENLLAAYNPETATTARKQTGSFYTPREIVDYMVDEALIAYLGTALGRDGPPGRPKANDDGAPGGRALPDTEKKLRHLFAYNDEPHQFSKAEVKILIEAIDNLKALDPACGSGAFPMGLLHKLVFILGKLDPHNEQWKEKQIAKASEIPDATVREKTLADIEQAFAANELDYGRKLYLIENCIYGVDIQPIAVQIAKMRFFISLIVEQRVRSSGRESAQTSGGGKGDQSRLTSAATEWNMGVRPLPNLETKFVAANTLIGIERPAQAMLRNPAIDAKEVELRQVRERHFTARTPATKAKCRELDAKLRAEIGELLRADGFARETTEKLANWNPYDQNASADFFDPEWMFGIPEGFHVVMGNPPYVRHETISNFRDTLAPQYETAASRADLFVFFFERGVRILSERGVLCFISSNKYFRAAYGEKLRQFLTVKTTIRRIVDFGDAPVFAAIAYASIFIANRGRPPAGHCLRALTWSGTDDFTGLATHVEAESSAIQQSALKTAGWNFNTGNTGLFEKLQATGTPLKEYVGGRFYYGIKTGLNDAFVIDEATRKRLIAEDKKSAELIRPWLRGRDVKRWLPRWGGLYAIVFPFGFNTELKRYPAVLKHLRQFEADLRRRGQCVSSRGGNGEGQHHWLELDNNPKPSYLEEFTRPKVIIPAIERGCAFAFDDSGCFSNDKTTICVSEDARFLCGLLNSTVIWWVIRQIAAERQNGYYEFKPMYVSRLPIPKASPNDRAKISSLVDKILAAKRADPAADVSAWEREIDQHVYRLYGLTAEEIKIVEEASQ